jgi:hypothetical protein
MRIEELIYIVLYVLKWIKDTVLQEPINFTPQFDYDGTLIEKKKWEIIEKDLSYI